MPKPLTVVQGIFCFFPWRAKYLLLIRHRENKTITARLQNFLQTIRDRLGKLKDFAIHLGHDFSGPTEDLSPSYPLFVRSYVAPDMPCFIGSLKVTFQSNPNGDHLLHMRLETFRIINQQGLALPRFDFSHPAID